MDFTAIKKKALKILEMGRTHSIPARTQFIILKKEKNNLYLKTSSQATFNVQDFNK